MMSTTQKQAIVFMAVALSSAMALQDETQTPTGTAPAEGAALSQGAMKSGGSALISEVMSDPMEQFASLDDDFDDKKLGAADPMDDFANLHDIFDDSSDGMQVEEMDIKDQVTQWLASPSLWFTASLILAAVFFMTSPDVRGESQQPAPAEVQTEVTLDGGLSLASVETEAIEQKNEAKDASKENVAILAEKNTPFEADVAPAQEEAAQEGEDELAAAAGACRSGEVGAYANFCKLLAEQNQLQ